MRLPYRQRFAIILNEFGTGLAGARQGPAQGDPRRQPGAARVRPRGRDPRASRTRCWRDGAKNGDKVLAEWAARRKQVADFDRAGQHRRAGDRRAARGPRAQLRAVPQVPAPAPTRRWCGSAQLSDADAAGRSPTCSRSATDVSRHPDRAGAVLARRHPGASRSSATPPTSAAPRSRRRSRRSRRSASFTAQAQSVTKNLAALLTSFDQTNGFKLPHRRDLQPGDVGQRLRPTSATTCARRCSPAATRWPRS